MIEQLVERPRHFTQILLDVLRVEQPRQPLQPDQAIERGRPVDPAVRRRRAQVHPARCDRGHALPVGVGTDGLVKVAIPGDHDVGIPHHHLLDRNLGDAAARAARVQGDVDRAGPLDDLGVDRAAEPGLETIGAAREIDPRSFLLRHVGERGVDLGQSALDVARDPLGPLLDPENRAEQAHRSGRVFEATIDQDVRDTGLRLDPLGERDIGVAHRAEVDDQVGLGLQQHLEIDRVATGERAEHRQVPVFRRDVGQVLGVRRTLPAGQAVRRQHVEQHRRGRPGREHPLDPVRHLDLAAGRVGDRARGLTLRAPREKRAQQRQADGQTATHRHSSAQPLSARAGLGVGEERLLAVDLERADGLLALVREHPVDEDLAELGLDVRMLRRD